MQELRRRKAPEQAILREEAPATRPRQAEGAVNVRIGCACIGVNRLGFCGACAARRGVLALSFAAILLGSFAFLAEMM